MSDLSCDYGAPASSFGFVASHYGFEQAASEVLLFRLTSPIDPPEPGARCAAIVRTAAESRAAIAAGHSTLVSFLGDESAPSNHGAAQINLHHSLASLGPGDIVAFNPNTSLMRCITSRTVTLPGSQSQTHIRRLTYMRVTCVHSPHRNAGDWPLEDLVKAIPLIGSQVDRLVISGQEPMTDADQLFQVVRQAELHQPAMEILIETSGEAFSRPSVTRRWSSYGSRKLIARIAIHASINWVHDDLAMSQGGFNRTILGLLRLKEAHQRIELTITLNAMTAPRIKRTCEWIARNLHFVDQVSLLGMSSFCAADSPENELWIDPFLFRGDLAFAVTFLEASGIQVAIHNLPLCVLEPSLWQIASSAISDLGGMYLTACQDCSARRMCGGINPAAVWHFGGIVRPLT